MDESMVKHSELEIWMKCHIIQNKGTLVFHGVQVNIGCDLHVQRHMHDTCLAYWIWLIGLMFGMMIYSGPNFAITLAHLKVMVTDIEF